MYYFDEIDGKKILKSDLIKNAQAFFTTREICICDKGVNDNIEVKNNIKIIQNYLKTKLISPTQTHSANVDIATENKFDYPDTDGLILTKNDIAVFLNFADCTPLIFYNEKQNIGAVSHAGWRGTAQKIAQITVQKLINEFGSNPKDICVLIGPAICGECYEVGEEVYSIFSPSPLPSPSRVEGGLRLDLKEINAKQLADIGIEKIDICPYCTCCDNRYFYSYRKENGTSLRHSAVLCLRNYEEK
jgi:YfiH family protein